MKKPFIVLFSFLFFLTIAGNAQKNPDNEILVYFSGGIQQEVVTLNGQIDKTARITSNKLKMSLSSIGIYDSLIEIALPRFEKSDTLITLSNGQTLEQPDMTYLYRIIVPNGQKRQDVVASLKNLPDVLYAEPNGKVSHHAIPSDTRFGEQWGLRNTAVPGADIHAVAAWDIYTGNSNNIIGIIDGGSLSTHADLNDKITGGDAGYGWEGHGIHVSGIAAAESNNSQGISGVDWQARIHPQRIDNVSDDAATYQAIVDAVNYSPNVQVLNNSWGLIDANGNPGRYSTTVRQAFAYAYKANRTSVASMGNHQQTNPGVVGYPGGFDNVISVGATDRWDGIGDFSCQGSHIDVCAPGVNVHSTIVGGYGNMTGTSMAAPHVSGIASLLKGFIPNLTNDDIENIIKLSADNLGDPGFDNTFGFGRVNTERALNLLRTPNSISQWSATSGNSVSSTGTFTMVFMGASGLASSTYIVKRYEVRKTVTFPSQFLQIIGVWGRGVSTTGWSQANPNFGEGFCEVVPGTQTNTSVTLRTYVYEIWSTSGSYLGYYPQSPSNVNFAYSVIGVLAPTLAGSSIVCTSGSTFSVNGLPANATIVWSYSSNLTQYNIGNDFIVLKATSNGTGWVQAVVNSSYGQYTIPVKTVWVGTPINTQISAIVMQGPPSGNQLCLNSNMTIAAGHSAIATQGITQYNWDFGNWAQYFQDYSPAPGPSQARPTFYLSYGAPTPQVIKITAQNQCGANWNQPFQKTFYAINCFGDNSFTLSPNPASDKVVIKVNDLSLVYSNNQQGDGDESSTFTEVRIFDQFGNQKQNNKYAIGTKETVINTSSLMTGTYFVQILHGTKKISEYYTLLIAK